LHIPGWITARIDGNALECPKFISHPNLQKTNMILFDLNIDIIQQKIYANHAGLSDKLKNVIIPLHMNANARQVQQIMDGNLIRTLAGSPCISD
jgi:hypothetical protein